jgi:hypothetical protein
MLIRSQDNKILVNLDNVESISVSTLDSSAVIWCGSRLIAEYSTEEKAIKVLDMIEAHYNEPIYSNHESMEETTHYLRASFQMPADDEVEDD